MKLPFRLPKLTISFEQDLPPVTPVVEAEMPARTSPAECENPFVFMKRQPPRGHLMTTVRTVVIRRVDVREEIIATEPLFRPGDWVEIYCGEFEGHEFVISDYRWNHDRGQVEYLYRFVGDYWYPEVNLVLRKRAENLPEEAGA
ncbi:hypothetical protein LAZ40_04405 [Cereibacter sphaeroides]|uniref:hypothetical protein n=1 Tax=Cereibacter sphaeroides TaxID=1063 RepID=UPI001F2CF844|nr:hypothetical protein [Cereibacter sphaeroides]MCE6958297.1 hypothetical protein [Cereibacter sphaeroides]MCE6971907.1 hypothetical protein [Cereibacter sphaeroides]